MRYRTQVSLTGPKPTARLERLVRDLQDSDCVVLYHAGQARLEVDLPDDAYTWIVSASLARLFATYGDVVRWQPNFRELLPSSHVHCLSFPERPEARGIRERRDYDVSAHSLPSPEREEKSCSSAC